MSPLSSHDHLWVAMIHVCMNEYHQLMGNVYSITNQLSHKWSYEWTRQHMWSRLLWFYNNFNIKVSCLVSVNNILECHSWTLDYMSDISVHFHHNYRLSVMTWQYTTLPWPVSVVYHVKTCIVKAFYSHWRCS